jgi:bifunctional non-homologous end joining protein LigD
VREPASHRAALVEARDGDKRRADLKPGVFKSADPKAPWNDPSERRLAVETEKHPLECAGFEGFIPEGKYDAGESRIWDRG